MELNINIKKGLGELSFDMPVEQVVALWGEADEVECIDNAADEPTTVLHYGECVTLFFEGNNPTLSCIDVSDPNATLLGTKPFSLKERELVQLMVKNNYFEQDADEEDWGERRISFNEGNIDFFFDNDELTSVLFGK